MRPNHLYACNSLECKTNPQFIAPCTKELSCRWIRLLQQRRLVSLNKGFAPIHFPQRFVCSRYLLLSKCFDESCLTCFPPRPLHRFLVLLATTLAAGIPSQVAVQSTILASEPQSPATIRLMTYNIHHCEGTEGKLDVERIAEIIRAQKCDLVALQEVDQGTKRSDKVNQAFELGKQLGMHAAFGESDRFRGRRVRSGSALSLAHHEPKDTSATFRSSARTTRRTLEISTQLENRPTSNLRLHALGPHLRYE